MKLLRRSPSWAVLVAKLPGLPDAPLFLLGFSAAALVLFQRKKKKEGLVFLLSPPPLTRLCDPAASFQGAFFLNPFLHLADLK